MEPLHVPVDREELQSKAVLQKSAGTPGPQIGLVIVDDGSDWVSPDCGNINLPSRGTCSAPDSKASKPNFPQKTEDMKVEDPEKSKNWEIRAESTDEKEKKASALNGLSTVAQPQKPGIAGEWTCKSCGNMNHVSRRFCSACYRERMDGVEAFEDASAANGQNGGSAMWRCPKCRGANFAHELVCSTPGCLNPAPTGNGAPRPPRLDTQSNIMDSRDLYRMNGRDGRARETPQQRLKRGSPANKKQGGRRDGSGGGIGEKRAGWYCERCNNFNFEGRLFCNIRTCRAPPPAPSSRRPVAPGRLPDDRKGWVCIECGNFNYESRKVCNMRACRAPRPQSAVQSQGAFPPKPSSTRSEAETEGVPQNATTTEPGWDCPRCGNYNFHGRKLCNMRKCREPRPDNPELRHSTSPRRSGGSRRDAPGVRRDDRDGGGKLGWTCEECGNFNFDTRRICNRRTCRVPRPPGARMWKRKSDTSNGPGRRRHRGSPPDQPRYLSTDAGFPPEMVPRAPPPALPGRSGRWVWYEGGDQDSYYPSEGRSAPEGGLMGGGGNAGRAMDARDLSRMDVRYLRGRGAGPVSESLPPPLQLRNSNRAGWGAGSGGVVQRSGSGDVIRSPVVGSDAILSEPGGSFYRFAQGRGSPSIQEMSLEDSERRGGGSAAIGEGGNTSGIGALSGGGPGGLGSSVKVYYPSFKENTNLSVI